MNGKKSEKKTIIALAAVLLLMAVSFAIFTTTLYIGGNAANGASVTVNSTSWSVHYVNTSLNETSTIKATTKTLTDTDYSFNVQLNQPGDVYDATWNVTNDGNFAAVLNEINMSTLDAAQKKYLSYTITYDGTTYSASNTSLALDLAVGATKTISLHLEYLMPSASADLPTTSQTITVSGNFVYNQKTS